LVDLEKIDRLNPDYLIVEESRYINFFTESVKREIFKSYKIVFHSQTYPYRCFVLKRKNMQSPELLLPTDGKEGKISEDIFKRSVPGVMKVGETYTAIVKVKNTGDSRTNFSVSVHSDEYIIFCGKASTEGAPKLDLDKGSTRMLKFKIIPLKEYVGELTITVNLYAKNEENEAFRKKVDSVSDYIYLIEK